MSTTAATAKEPKKSKKKATPKVSKPRVKGKDGTKTAKVLEILKGGATMAQLRKLTGWQPHSVRGFLSGTVRKKMGLNVTSVKDKGQERVYKAK